MMNGKGRAEKRKEEKSGELCYALLRCLLTALLNHGEKRGTFPSMQGLDRVGLVGLLFLLPHYSSYRTVDGYTLLL
ncbi:hypothetical protein NPIL_62101 [Nephila pilipes]|uniref:Uncharacterized protein n=1 Tax=Nephila pilipes TaxID=299642 RepID=A0A8X6NZQ9_NEPPI|nr:hypothetical protein NPIL_62101 [Nephila pilipes]